MAVKKATTTATKTAAKPAPKAAAPKAAAKPATKAAATKTATKSAAKTECTSQECQDRNSLVAMAAYLKAERRGFVGGDEKQDWFEAEQEVDAYLAKKKKK